MQFLTDFIMVLGIAVTTALLVERAFYPAHASTALAPDAPIRPEPSALLFENGILHHATDTAARDLEMEAGTHDWEDLSDALDARFPDFPRMAHSGLRGSQTLDAIDGDDPEQVRIRWRGDLCWVSLFSAAPEQLQTPVQNAALTHLGHTAATSPHPAWALNDQGEVVWQNAAYQQLGKQVNVDVKRHLLRLLPT